MSYVSYVTEPNATKLDKCWSSQEVSQNRPLFGSTFCFLCCRNEVFEVSKRSNLTDRTHARTYMDFFNHPRARAPLFGANNFMAGPFLALSERFRTIWSMFPCKNLKNHPNVTLWIFGVLTIRSPTVVGSVGVELGQSWDRTMSGRDTAVQIPLRLASVRSKQSETLF